MRPNVPSVARTASMTWSWSVTSRRRPMALSACLPTMSSMAAGFRAGALSRELRHSKGQHPLAQVTRIEPIVHAGIAAGEDERVGTVVVGHGLGLVQAAGAAGDVECRSPDVGDRHDEVQRAAVVDVDDEGLLVLQPEVATDVDLVAEGTTGVGRVGQAELVGRLLQRGTGPGQRVVGVLL